MRERGFTLIEVAVVIAVLAIAAAIAIPEFRQITDANVKSEAGMLAGAIEYANTQAVTRRRFYRLYFDLAKQRFWLARRTPGGYKEDKTSMLARSRPLSEGVSFEVLLIAGTLYKPGPALSEPPYLEFLPDGTTDDAILCLKSEQDDHYSLEVDPLTAASEIESECPDLSNCGNRRIREAQ